MSLVAIFLLGVDALWGSWARRPLTRRQIQAKIRVRCTPLWRAAALRRAKYNQFLQKALPWAVMSTLPPGLVGHAQALISAAQLGKHNEAFIYCAIIGGMLTLYTPFLKAMWKKQPIEPTHMDSVTRYSVIAFTLVSVLLERMNYADNPAFRHQLLIAAAQHCVFILPLLTSALGTHVRQAVWVSATGTLLTGDGLFLVLGAVSVALGATKEAGLMFGVDCAAMVSFIPSSATFVVLLAFVVNIIIMPPLLFQAEFATIVKSGYPALLSSAKLTFAELDKTLKVAVIVAVLGGTCLVLRSAPKAAASVARAYVRDNGISVRRGKQLLMWWLTGVGAASSIYELMGCVRGNGRMILRSLFIILMPVPALVSVLVSDNGKQLYWYYVVGALATVALDYTGTTSGNEDVMLRSLFLSLIASPALIMFGPWRTLRHKEGLTFFRWLVAVLTKLLVCSVKYSAWHSQVATLGPFCVGAWCLLYVDNVFEAIVGTVLFNAAVAIHSDGDWHEYVWPAIFAATICVGATIKDTVMRYTKVGPETPVVMGPAPLADAAVDPANALFRMLVYLYILSFGLRAVVVEAGAL